MTHNSSLPKILLIPTKKYGEIHTFSGVIVFLPHSINRIFYIFSFLS